MARENSRAPRKAEENDGLIKKLICVNRVTKTVKGGRNMRFAALVVVGDGAGKVGCAMGKAKEVPEAIEKATLRAKKNMVSVAIVDNTIPHQVIGKFGRGAVLMPIGRKDILDIIQSVKEQTTVLFSTHILSDVEKICTDVAFLNDGKIVQQGKVAQLKTVYSAHEFVIEFIKEEDGEKVLETFDKVRQKDKNSLIFQGGEDRMLELMRYVADSQIPVSKIERIEPSMETLFLEVASK